MGFTFNDIKKLIKEAEPLENKMMSIYIASCKPAIITKGTEISPFYDCIKIVDTTGFTSVIPLDKIVLIEYSQRDE
jgi:hypothetical protein